MKKQILSLIVIIFSLMAVNGILAIEFNSSILDSTISTNPAMKTVNGVTHLVWSEEDKLLYANSIDNYVNRVIISNNMSNYKDPSIDVSNGIVHVAFNAYTTKWKTFYANSNGWNVIDLNLDGYRTISLAIDKNNKVYIAGQKVNPAGDIDINILSSNNYTSFNRIVIPKIADQIDPEIAIDSNNIVHLVYDDLSDGEINEMGQYKIRYRSSLDNFATEQNISNAPQSYSADIKVGPDNDVWVLFKDSTYVDQGAFFGDIFLADKNSNWTKERITNESVSWEDRPVSLAIDANGKYMTWCQWNGEANIDVMLATEHSPLVVTSFDTGNVPGLGWSVIDIDENGNPIIMANIHSLASYVTIQEGPSLQEQIDNLTGKFNDLQSKYNNLDNRTTYLERVINALFSWSSDFMAYWNSPDKCINNQLRCSSNNLQKCINYAWTQNQVCTYGCENNQCKPQPFVCTQGTKQCSGSIPQNCNNNAWVNGANCTYGCVNGICNNPPIVKENCATKPNDYYCSNGYSYTKDYYYCESGQGTTTSCNVGKCVGSNSPRYCMGKGCNTTTGKCNP